MSADAVDAVVAAGVAAPEEAFLCTAAKALPALPTELRRRTLSLLANCLSASPTYGNRMTRAVQGVVGQIPTEYQWLAYGAFRNRGLLGQMGYVLPGLLHAASDCSRWNSYPELAHRAHRNRHDTGLDAVCAPDARIYFSSPAEAITAIHAVVDEDIKVWWISKFPWRNVAQLRSSEINMVWSSRTPRVEAALLVALPE